MFLLTWIRRLYKTLSADASPEAIAFAALFGLTAGFLPPTSGIFVLLALSILIVRVQITSAILFWGIGSLIRVSGAAALFAIVGENLLEQGALRGFWTWFLNLPVVAWLDLHIYAVLGGAVCGVILGALVFWPIRLLIISYRRYAHERVSQNKFFRWLNRLWLWRALRFVFLGVRS